MSYFSNLQVFLKISTLFCKFSIVISCLLFLSILLFLLPTHLFCMLYLILFLLQLLWLLPVVLYLSKMFCYHILCFVPEFFEVLCLSILLFSCLFKSFSWRLFSLFLFKTFYSFFLIIIENLIKNNIICLKSFLHFCFYKH